MLTRAIVFVTIGTLFLIAIFPSCTTAIPKRTTRQTHEEICAELLCPYVNPPSCNCNNGKMPVWMKRNSGPSSPPTTRRKRFNLLLQRLLARYREELAKHHS